MGIITRIGSAPGVRRLVRRRPPQGEVRESPDCGGSALSAEELARRTGTLSRQPGTGPTDW